MTFERDAVVLLELEAHLWPHMVGPTFQSSLQLCHLSLQGLAEGQEVTSLLPSPAQLRANLQPMPTPEVWVELRGKSARHHKA